jgi:hypothetical protein
VLDKSDDAITEEIDQLLFGIFYHDEGLTVQALDDDIWARQIQQGKLSVAQVAREQEEGIGWQWSGSKLRSSL